MAAFIPDPLPELPVLAPEDHVPVDMAQVRFLGPWEGTLTWLPIPPPVRPTLWLRAPGHAFAVGEEVRVVLAQQEYRCVVVEQRRDATETVYGLTLMPDAPLRV